MPSALGRVPGAALVLMLLITGAWPVDGSAAAGAGPAQVHSFYLTPEPRGNGPGPADATLMRDRLGDDVGLDVTVPLLGDAATTLGVPAPHHGASTRAWVAEAPFGDDRAALGVATIELWFDAEFHLDAALVATLGAIGEDGVQHDLAAWSQPLALGPQERRQVTLHLEVDDVHIEAGTTLMLTLAVDGTSLLHWLRYGGAAAPSGLHITTVDERDRVDAAGVAGPPSSARRDHDGDGLPDAVEHEVGTDPLRPDTDGDGVMDGIEHRHGTDALDAGSRPRDTDGDGLPDTFESAHGLDPTRRDSNGDGILDGDGDPDDDGLRNILEAAHGTDPTNPDTDGDGFVDGLEVARGWDPLVPQAAPDRVDADVAMAAVALAGGAGALIVSGVRPLGVGRPLATPVAVLSGVLHLMLTSGVLLLTWASRQEAAAFVLAVQTTMVLALAGWTWAGLLARRAAPRQQRPSV